MPSFSKRSKDNLSTCDNRLQRLFNIIIFKYDCTIIEGYRPLDRQEELWSEGKSKARYSKHNESPALAVDVAPYVEAIRGIPWPDRYEIGSNDYIKALAQFYHFAGYVQGIADSIHLRIRFGGDWDRDNYLSDQKFDDLVHFELID